MRARELLEMERDALRMFTSCAWFFDDIGGIEAQQVLRYAARAISLAGAERGELEEALLSRLRTAQSNDRAVGTGRDVYLAHARPRTSVAERVAASELACHALGVPFSISFAAADVAFERDHIVVTERRTGRVHRFSGAVESRSASDVRVNVTRLDEAGTARQKHVFTVRDFPERARREVRAILRHELLPRCLTPAELHQLAAGDASLRTLVAVALGRNMARLADPSDGEALALVDALVDLFEQLEEKIPFDAQTAFWRVWESAAPARRLQLSGLRWRLGFLEDNAAPAGDGMTG